MIYDYYENSINDTVRWNKTRLSWEKWYKNYLRPSELLDVNREQEVNVFESIAYPESIAFLEPTQARSAEPY
jgi:hypothetical protein